jgi:HemY protein
MRWASPPKTARRLRRASSRAWRASARIGCRAGSAWQAFPREGASHCRRLAPAECGLWGKAQQALQQAADDELLPKPARRRAWRQLAELAQQQGDAERSGRCYAAAAQIG